MVSFDEERATRKGRSETRAGRDVAPTNGSTRGTDARPEGQGWRLVELGRPVSRVDATKAPEMPPPFRRVENGSRRYGGPGNSDPAYSSLNYHFSRVRAHELNRSTDLWLSVLATGGVALALLLVVALQGLFGGRNALVSPSSSSSSGQLEVPVVTSVPSASPTISPSTPPPETVPPSFRTYTVRTGDTVTRIANKFGIKVWELLLANPSLAANPDQLYVGTVLDIPVHGQLTPAP